MHNKCVTHWIEDESGLFWLNLVPFKNDPTSIIDKPCFAGYTTKKGIDKLLILKAFEFHEEMHQFSPQTRAGEAGDYILKEAIFADMMSILYSNSSDNSHFFTPYELHLMIDLNEHRLKDILKNLTDALQGGKGAFRIFQEYMNLLQHSLQSMLAVKKELSDSENSEMLECRSDDNSSILDLILHEEEWPTIQDDFENRWPLNPGEMDFFILLKKYFDGDIQKIKLTLTEIDRGILLTTEEQDKEKLTYLENVLRSYLKEVYYIKQFSNEFV